MRVDVENVTTLIRCRAKDAGHVVSQPTRGPSLKMEMDRYGVERRGIEEIHGAFPRFKSPGQQQLK